MKITVKHNNAEIILESNNDKGVLDYNEYTNRTISVIAAMCEQMIKLTNPMLSS